jgi:hypothetical protein
MAVSCCTGIMQVSAQSSARDIESIDHTDRVRGVVVNSVTHEPIARALVFSTDNRFATMTDDRGRFEFVFPRAEPHQTGGFGPGASAQSPQFQAAASRPTSLMVRKVGFLALNNIEELSQINSTSGASLWYGATRARLISYRCGFLSNGERRLRRTFEART